MQSRVGIGAGQLAWTKPTRRQLQRRLRLQLAVGNTFALLEY